MKKKLTLLLASTFIVTFSEAKSNTFSNSLSNYSFPYAGRTLFSATGSSVGIFGGDNMLPLYGNKDEFLFGDFMGDYGTDDTFLLSPGGGLRKNFGHKIVGAYFFGDYERTSLGTNFWNLSPGIEWIEKHWDAHINGYFPTNTSKQSGPEQFLDTFENYSQVSFETGTHNQYDELVTPYAIIGNGVDAAIGYSFASKNNLRSRVNLGVYYYQPPHFNSIDNITGVTAGFEQPLSQNVSLAFINSYDQVSQYTVGVSLKVTFGGKSNIFSNNIRDRFLDPVQRHIGIIGTGAGTYDQQYLKNEGTALEYDNIYFVSAEGNGDGTYNNSASLTQTTLDSIYAENSQEAQIYLQGNTAYYINSSTAGNQNSSGYYGLSVYPGQDFYGRTADYTTPALSINEQPQIQIDAANNYNGFIVQGGKNTFSNISITEYSSSNGVYNSSGIVAYNNTPEDMTLNIFNTHIYEMDTNGVFAQNNSIGTFTINAINSQFNDNGILNENHIGIRGEGNIAGLYAENNASGTFTVYAINSQFNGNGTFNGNDDGTAGNIAGVYALNNSTGSFNLIAINSQFNSNGTINGHGSGLDGDIAGIYAENNTGIFTMQVIHSQFNNNGTFNGSRDGIGGTIAGVDIINQEKGSFTMNAFDSQFNNNGLFEGHNSGNGGNIAGINAVNNGIFTLNATDSQFNNNGLINGSRSGSGGVIAGINAKNSGTNTMTINVANSQLNNNGEINGNRSGVGMVAGMNTVNNNEGTIRVNAINSQFNNNGIINGEQSGIGLAAGISAINNGSGTLNIEALDSQFNNNGIVNSSNSGTSLGTGLLLVNDPKGSFFVDIVGSNFKGNKDDAIHAEGKIDLLPLL